MSDCPPFEVLLYGGISPSADGLETIRVELEGAGELGHAMVGRHDPTLPAVACWACLVCERSVGYDPITGEVWGRALTEACGGPPPSMGA